MTYHWYALSCKPNKEEIIGKQLQDQGYEVFCPYIPVSKDAGSSNTNKPLFPGYVFIRIDIDESGLSAFQWMKHSTGIVCMGGKPSHVPDRMVEAIQRKITGGHLKHRNHSGSSAESISEQDDGIPPAVGELFESSIPHFERTRVLLEMLSDGSSS